MSRKTLVRTAHPTAEFFVGCAVRTTTELQP